MKIRTEEYFIGHRSYSRHVGGAIYAKPAPKPPAVISLLPQNIKWSADGTTYIENDGTSKPNNNGTPYAANHLWLNGVDQSVDYPVIHQLGNNIVDSFYSVVNASDAVIAYTGYDDGVDLSVTQVSTNNQEIVVYHNVSANYGDKISISFTATVNSGSAVVSRIRAGDYNYNVNYTVVDGYNELELDGNSALSNQLGVYFKSDQLFDIEIRDLQCKPITIPSNSYIAYYDSDQKRFVQEDNTIIPVATHYKMTKSHQLYITNTKALTAAELAQLNANPNLIMKVWFDGLVLADGFQKSDIVDFCVPIDSYSNKYVQNIAKPKVNLRPNNQLPPEGDVNNLRIAHTPNGFMVEVLSNGGLQTDPILFNNDIVPQNTPFCGFTVNVSNRMRFYRIYGQKSEKHTAIGEYKCSFGDNITSPGKYNILTCCEDNFSPTNNLWAYVSTQAEDISIGDTVEFTDFWAYDIESYEVVNYTAACRSTLANQDFGITNFLLSQDTAGMPTGTTSGFTGSDDGRKITVDLNDYAITVSCAKRLHGDDSTTLTIEEC